MSSVNLPGHSAHATTSHVHFNVEDNHESDIVIEEKEEGIMEVHVGFLKIFHVYNITFNVPHKLGKDISFDPLENLLVKVKDAKCTEDGHELVVEFNAQREKLMKEKITLRSKSSDDAVFIIFMARVLGKHKGTPSLRNGIHFVRTEGDDDDSSDWPGF